ncbi:TIR domain-containing protein [Enterobacter bugandensis]|uniref:TIR domain-containing protein n=1 Tax=Enterobacter bugandensis TaxID=881260 RepID=UPI001F3C0FAA|nr:TIR domain-containing protein [Enterobacter bugandensis]MCK7409346.1 nucleotide-binding protein [Enterobacter bugandensis]
MDDTKLERFDSLFRKADEISQTKRPSSFGGDYINDSLFIEWKIKVENLLLSIFDEKSPILIAYYTQRDTSHFSNAANFEALKAVLKAAQSEYKDGVISVRQPFGDRVFIGHGRSPLWRELKDYISDNLHLKWDEFNRTPIAGLSTAARLSEMMNHASIAFLVMTAEDEQADGSINARMNVIHEVGLFQGKLGFEKAIILMEEDCAEFTNINGLGQIRFPKGNISAIFHHIRNVLEREEIIK